MERARQRLSVVVPLTVANHTRREVGGRTEHPASSIQHRVGGWLVVQLGKSRHNPAVMVYFRLVRHASEALLDLQTLIVHELLPVKGGFYQLRMGQGRSGKLQVGDATIDFFINGKSIDKTKTFQQKTTRRV